jgi:hypothetical protein
MPEYTETADALTHLKLQPHTFKDDSDLLKARDNFLSVNPLADTKDVLYLDTLLQLAYVCGQAKAITGIKGEF